MQSDAILDLIGFLRRAADELDAVNCEALKNAKEIRKRDDIIDELRDEVDMLKANIKRLEAGAKQSELSHDEIVAQLFSKVVTNGSKLDLFADETWVLGKIWATLDSDGSQRISCDAANLDVLFSDGSLKFSKGGIRELKWLYYTICSDDADKIDVLNAKGGDA